MNNYKKILKTLFNQPTYKFHIRELARTTKLNPNTIINITKNLEKENIIKIERKKYITEITLNLKDKKTIWKKRIFNLTQIYDSSILDFLKEKYSPSLISLIGSYSRGEDIKKSDIDIVIITNKKEILNLSKFEKNLKRNIHLIIFKDYNLPKELFNNLINGVVLYGYIRK